MLDLKTVPLIRTEIPGPESQRLLGAQNDLETRTIVYPRSFPIAVKRANGSIIEDADGNLLIDWVTGVSVLNLGHDDGTRDSIRDQLDSVWHALEIPTDTRIRFMDNLRRTFPAAMGDYRIMFGISGADACETAVNIAHSVHGGNHSTFVFEGAYHGVSGGIISATAGSRYRKTQYSHGFETVRIPYPYSFWYDVDTEEILEQMRKVMLDPEAGYSIPDSVLVEPIQGEGGYIVPPEGFLKALREFCDQFDLTLIVDEVQAGMGRTGKMWAFQWESIIPDIVCVGKTVGGGMPISVIYYRDDYDRQLPSPFHMGTYRANVLALAAGNYVMEEIPKHLDRVIRDGRRIMDYFRTIDSALIGEVRGKGFMIGVELVDGSRPMRADQMLHLKHEMLHNGLMMHTCGHYNNVFRFMGALNIPDSLLDRGMEIFRDVLENKEGYDGV